VAAIKEAGGGLVEAYPEQVEGRESQRGASFHTGPEDLFGEFGFERDRRIAKWRWVMRRRVLDGRKLRRPAILAPAHTIVAVINKDWQGDSSANGSVTSSQRLSASSCLTTRCWTDTDTGSA